MLTIIAVDDQNELLESLVQHLKTLDFAKLITATTDPLVALTYIATTKPHVVLLDIDMPELDGLSRVLQQINT